MAALPSALTTLPETYLRFLPPIRLKCRRLLRHPEDAEDVAHETFIRLLQSGPVWSGAGDTPVVMAWLYRTCTRLSIDVMRQRIRVRLGSLDDGDDVPRPCGGSPDHALNARRLIRALCGEAPAEQLEAAVLCRVDGLSQVEAALVLGVSERTLRRLIDRFDEHALQYRKEFAS